jgi:hypothetical protein
MSHYAKVNNGIVVSVIVAEADFFTNGHFVDTSPGTWIQTSYNTRGNVHYGQDGQPDGGIALRGNYAGVGYIYDATNDVFYPPKPFASWTINEPTWTWTPPTPYPTDVGTVDAPKHYVWDETTTSWTEVTQ